MGEIVSIFRVNDWNIKQYVLFIAIIQLSTLFMVGVDNIYKSIPLSPAFTAVLGAIFLLYVPGSIILRILKLHNMPTLNTILFTVGISLATIMFLGLLINIVGTLLAIPNPLSPNIVIISFFIVYWILLVISYISDRNYSASTRIGLEEQFHRSTVVVPFVLFFSIIGTFFVNYWGNNLVLFIFISVLCIIIFLLAYSNFFSTFQYPFIIWITAVSLIYSDTLISHFINKYDVITEYHFANLIIQNQYWDWAIPSSHNSMLSCTMIPHMFNIFCQVDLTIYFKVLIPIIFSLVPLGVYAVLRERTSLDIALFSVLFIMVIKPFFQVIPSIGKQVVAEFFLVLILILILNNNIDGYRKSFLLLLFSSSLIVSHYGTSYLVMFSLCFCYVCMYLIKRLAVVPISMTTIHTIINYSQISYPQKRILSSKYIMFFIMMTFLWFIYTSSSISLMNIVNIGSHVSTSILTEFMNPETSRGMSLVVKSSDSLLHTFDRYLNITVLLLIPLGFIRCIATKNIFKMDLAYISFSLFWLVIDFASIAISGFAVMNPFRLFHISLLVLAPFAIVGFTEIVRIFLRNSSEQQRISNYFISLLIVTLLLFNIGALYEITHDSPNSLSLSQETIKNYDDIRVKGQFVNLMREEDVHSAVWLEEYRDDYKSIFITKGNGEGSSALVSYGMIIDDLVNIDDKSTIMSGDYVFLGFVNVVLDVGIGLNKKLSSPTYYNMSELDPLLYQCSRIYNNGGNNIFSQAY